MSLDHLRSSLLGSPLQCSPNRSRNGSRPVGLVRERSRSRAPRFSLFGQGQQRQQKEGFLQFVKGFVRLPMRNLVCREGLFRVNCTKEPVPKSLALVRSLEPLWKEGLLIVRCSVFFAVLSAAAMLVWYGQQRSRAFVEAQLLPSVCSILSKHLQRELDFSKVRSVSPLGITLQSCSVGPHSEEFSCGELPTMKLRVRPLASLRRGKIVVDAVLSRPNILIAQKEDFSWLGLPPPSADGLMRHSSSEEGIDYRTKTRRLAREEAAAQWRRERVDAAKKAAERGYIVPQESLDMPTVAEPKDGSSPSTESANSNSSSFFCMDERKHLKDHHCIDMGVEYLSKHADLEKSFGINIPTKGFRFWPKILSTPLKGKLKRESHKKVIDEAVMAYKKRNLERSAVAALAYFRGPDGGDTSLSSYRRPSNDFSCDVDIDASRVKQDEVSTSNATLCTVNESQNFEESANFVDINGESCITHKYSGDDTMRYENQENLSPSQNTNVSEGVASLERPHDLPCMEYMRNSDQLGAVSSVKYPRIMVGHKLDKLKAPIELFQLISSFDKSNLTECRTPNESDLQSGGSKQVQPEEVSDYSKTASNGSQNSMFETLVDISEAQSDISQEFTLENADKHVRVRKSISMQPWNLKFGSKFFSDLSKTITDYFGCHVQILKSYVSVKAEELNSELADGVASYHTESIKKMLPITLDSVYFTEGTLMLLGYGDLEPREMDNVNGHVKFQNHYTRIHVQLSGNCKEWRSDATTKDGGQLSAGVFVDIVDQKWHANLKVENIFAPLFERILELPITWLKGRASGEVHICMSEGETFPNIHGQLDVHDLAFQILDAPSSFSDITANLCFRGQRIFLHNASGRFGDAPLEASGDFGINPEDGQFHLMCQVPCVEVNSLVKTLKMKPLLFSLAGSVTAVFNCQGPLDAPVFVGSGIISRKTPHLASSLPPSPASEAVNKNKEAGAVAAFDHIPFSHVSANFTFNSDNSVADLYGMRATLLDGGEIRGAGNAWICPEGEMDDSAMDLNLSGNFFFDRVIHRYIPSVKLMPLKIGELNGETKLSGSLLKPRFDIKWAAPKAEDSFSEARGDIIISHDNITVSSSSVAFDLYMKVQTSYPNDSRQDSNTLWIPKAVPLIVEGLDMDLRLRGFEFSSLVFPNPFDSPRPVHLKATGKIKFLGKVVKSDTLSGGNMVDEDKDMAETQIIKNKQSKSLVGDISLSGIKLNQLMLAPQLTGSLSISSDKAKLDATGRPDENMSVEVVGPLWPTKEEFVQNRTLFSVLLQKGQLRANINYQPQHLASLEVRHLPLDELELASLRGTIQRAELQLNFQKRRGHGLLSVLRPKFSGVLGEALDVAARWSGDVITIEKTILEQAFSRYELQGEYVLPGSRDRYFYKEKDGSLRKALDGHLGSLITSMGRWRMRLEVPGAEVAEMLPLARLLSRSIDPSVHSRSKDLFMQSVQSMGFHAGSLRELLEAIQKNDNWSDDIVTEEISLPGLAELKGHWRGSLDASGGGDGDTMAEFDFHGEDWEWGSYKTQRVLALGAYSNNNGLRLDNMFIQKDDATLHADGTVLGPISNLHFAVLNFPVGLVPTVAQIIESSATDSLGSQWHLLAPIKGILHMEGDLRGTLAKPECDVQVRLLDGAIGGIDLGRAEVVASITRTSRFLFNANFEPVIQSGHVHIQGSVPVTYKQNDSLEEEGKEKDLEDGTLMPSGWVKENLRGSIDENEKKIIRDRSEDGWDSQLAESLKGLNWNLLDDGEVKIDADIKDGGMTLLTAMCPYANWLHGYADISLQVRGTVEQPVIDGSASFHRASVSSPVFQKPLTNFGGTVHVKANRLCIISMEGRVSRKGKLVVKGNLPLRTSESSFGDKIDLKCEVLEVRAKNVFSGQVDSHVQIIGSILQPNISGRIKLSHGEAYLPHDKGNGEAINRLASKRPSFPAGIFSRSGHVSRFFGSQSVSPPNKLPKRSDKEDEVEKTMDQVNNKPGLDVRLTDLRLFLGPELRIVYPLILNFAVSGGLELNGIAHPKLIRPKGVLTFENGDVNLVATQVRLKRDHLNIAKFEPDLGLDPTLDLALVGSEWQFRIQSPASKWQDNLVITSTRSVDQDVLSPSEAAKVFENQLAESLLERDGQLAFKKLATATLETLMPKIEGKGEFGQARWRLVYAPQIPSLLSVDPTIDPLKSLANNISFGTEVEVQLGKRLQASVVRQMKDSEMAVQWTLVYQLTNRLRVLFQSSPATRLLFEYSATSQN